MANGVNYEDYSALAIRITNGPAPNGTGTLFLRKDEEDPLILTAAHVTHGKEKLRLKDGKNRQLKIIKIYEYEGYQHDENGEETFNDAAIIQVKWEEWMKGMERFQLRNPNEQKKMILWGYPQGLAVEETEGRTSLEGKITSTNADWWSGFTYWFQTATQQLSRSAFMQGFSGSGVFTNEDTFMVYGGAISGGAGAENAGNIAKVTKAELFLELMEKHGFLTEHEVQLEDYIDENLNKISPSKTEARRYFGNAMDRIIDDGVTAKDFLLEGEDRFEKLPCKYGHRSRCNVYWDGQLTMAVACCDILEQDKAQLCHMQVPIEDDRVNIALLCTEEPAESCIHTMLEQGYFSKEGSVKNNTILLWANKGAEAMYNQTFRRKEAQRIMNNIIEKQDLRERQLKKMLDTESTQGFNIIDGVVEDFNIGILGIGKINNDIIAEAEADERKEELESLLGKVWKKR